MHFIIHQRLRLRRLTVADATHLRAIDRRPLVDLARCFRFGLIAILFDIPLDLCLARNARRSRIVPEDALIDQHRLLERTSRSLAREGFGQVFVLDELTQNEVSFTIGRRINRLQR